MKENEHDQRPSLGDRLLDKLSDSMNRTLHHLWHHRREDHDAEAAKRLDGYGKAYEGPARKMLDTVEQRAREGGPGWREKPLPGLEPTLMEQDYMRLDRQVQADEQRRRDAIDRPRPGPVSERERLSVWADEMKQAESTALKAAAVENTHDHSRGRDQ